MSDALRRNLDWNPQFAHWDRRCRAGDAAAADWLARARQLKASGDQQGAIADLKTALDKDPANPAANAVALQWLEGAERADAALRLIAGGGGSSSALRGAIAVSLAGAKSLVHRLRAEGEGVRGWVAWASGSSRELRCFGGGGTWSETLSPDSAHALASEDYSIADFAADAVDELFDGPNAAPVFRRAGRAVSTRPPLAESVSSGRLSVIVPIYGDHDATAACLESLFAQEGADFSIVLVDDCSPDEQVAALVSGAAARPGVIALRNESNLGFAQSVNRALALRKSGDVLLLNADVWLPPRTLAKLQAAAASDRAIGTVTPFSNNSQITSFPRPYRVNDMPSASETTALDACAEQANGAGTVDIPSGIGFCLYISQDCLDAVGSLPEHYGRGYYEDVEFCWRAAELGFRNVCATGIFVAHKGSASFQTDKPQLAARNVAILETRFPRRGREFFAFAAADPLRFARAEIERRKPLEGAFAILLASEGGAEWQAGRRAREIESEGGKALLCCLVRTEGKVDLRRIEAGEPASLSFSVDSAGLKALEAYLKAIEVSVVEIFDGVDAPDALMKLLLRLDAPIDLFCIDLRALRGATPARTGTCEAPDAAGPCEACVQDQGAEKEVHSTREREARLVRLFAAARSIRSADRLGEAFVHRVFGARAGAPWTIDGNSMEAEPIAGDSTRLAVLVLSPSLECDRIAVRLARKLARPQQHKQLVIFGSSLAEESLLATGAAFVTGPADPSEYSRLIRLYGVGRLAVLDRSGMFGPLDAVSRKHKLPKAYFDWSFGAVRAEPGDLAIDPRTCDEKAALAVASWLNSD